MFERNKFIYIFVRELGGLKAFFISIRKISGDVSRNEIV